MFGKRKREGEVNGLHWEDLDDIYYLKRILEKQNEILNMLKNVDDNIVKYFGEEHELRERELNKKIRDAKFSNEQFEVLKETIAYTKEKHSKPIDKNKCEDCKYYINNKCTHPYSTCCKHCELWTPKWFE